MNLDNFHKSVNMLKIDHNIDIEVNKIDNRFWCTIILGRWLTTCPIMTEEQIIDDINKFIKNAKRLNERYNNMKLDKLKYKHEGILYKTMLFLACFVSIFVVMLFIKLVSSSSIL